MDIEKARLEARKILDEFGKDLKKVKISDKFPEPSEDASFRHEKKGQICDVEFKTIMFKNAPRKDDECLILEKGSWT